MANVTINGQNYQVEDGISVLQACKKNGVDVPHFCYHPCLSIAGNCRMCLVKVEKIPKPAIACATRVNDGMVIDTEAPEIVKIRENIMEFLLINHPLDCPVCDQAGECRLQDHSYKYGRSVGRFVDDKVVKQTKNFGKHVKYWGSRCILCTRCVRFCREISGTEELAVFNRGDHSEINFCPGNELDNSLSMNVVDVCPVGALVSADFLYQARVWNLTQKESLCLDCSVGCNVRIDSLNNEIKRIVPRKNSDVNSAFMCDHGRLGFDYIHSDGRTEYPTSAGKNISWKTGIDLFQKKITEYRKQSDKLSFLVSAWCSNETLYLIKTIKDQFLPNSEIYFYARPQEKEEKFPKFRISGDKNPNVNGIKALFSLNTLEGKPLKGLIEKIKKKKTKALILLGGIPNGYIPDNLVAAESQLDTLIAIDFIKNSVNEKADLLLPSLTYAEKSGSYINDQNRVQKLLPAINPVTGGKPEEVILQELRNALTGEEKVLSTSAVFDQMKEIPLFKNIDYRSLKNCGIQLSDA